MENTEEFSFQPISDKYTEEINNKLNVLLGDLIEIHPSKCVMTLSIKKYFEKIQNFKVYPDDTWLVGFPKSGTTWTQEMVWLLVNNLDFDQAKSIPSLKRFPLIEQEILRPDWDKTIDLAANLPRPRCIKALLPSQLLPKEIWTVKPKIIHVFRDPRDVAISYFHHHRAWRSYTGTLEDFMDVFLADRVICAPFWNHVLSFYKLNNQPNILYNTFEEMKKDLGSVIKRTANFLNVNITDDQVQQLKEYLSFEKMKDNSSCNWMHLKHKGEKELKKEDDEDLNFIRKGESGGWKKILSKDVIDKFDKWNEKNLNGTGFDKYPKKL